MLHEGDIYFERCYGADFSANIERNWKEACWQAWIAHYTKHQPAHRVDYALGRIEALQNGEPSPVLPGLPWAGLDAGARDDARAEPPGADAAASDTSAWLLSPITEGDAGSVPHGCARYCDGYAARCRGRCDKANVACQAGCTHERAICLNGCY